MEGKTLSHFKLGEKIGEGGMGIVYRAEDISLGRTVAIKVLPPALVADEDRRRRLIAEARTAAAVTHTNIAAVYEVGEADGSTFIAMELIEGESLTDHIANEPLPLKEAARIGAEIAEGLAAAHQAGIVHRDLKPHNVVITKDGHVKILDFGLAQLLSPRPASGDQDVTTTLPADEGVFGTPAYMSPEQARGKPLDTRSDIFSFGCVLYQMITGRTPFRGRTATDTISQLINHEAPQARTLNPDVSDNFQWILTKCLQKDPSQRYQDSRDLAVDLRQLLTESGSQITSSIDAQTRQLPAAPAAAAPLWKRPAVIGAALAVLVAAVFLPRLFTGGSSVPEASANSLAVFSFENLKDPDDPERLGQILQELVITDLSSGAGSMKILGSQRLHDVGNQLGKDADDKAASTDIAVKAGAGKMMTGTLSQLGEKWILVCQVTDVGSGEVVQSQRIDGDDLYAMVDQLTNDIRTQFQLAAPAELADAGAAGKTTPSLEAYKHYLDGLELFRDEAFSQSVPEFRKAIEIDPDFGQAYYKLALALWWPGGDNKEAQDVLDHMLTNRLYTSEREKGNAEGALMLIRGQFAEGLAKYEQLTQDYPDDKEAWYGLGEANFHYYGGGRDAAAFRAFKQAAALDPEFTLPYNHIFDVYEREERGDEAMAEAAAKLERDPESPLWNRKMALAVAISGDLKAVEKAVDEALKYNTSKDEQKTLYSEVSRTLGNENSEASIKYLKMASKADPEDGPLMIRLIRVLQSEGKDDEAEAMVLQGLKIHPELGQFDVLYRQVLRQRWEYEKARDYSKGLFEKSGNLTHAVSWLWNEIQLGDPVAIAQARTAADRLAQSPDEKRLLLNQLISAYQATDDQIMARKTAEALETAAGELDPALCGLVAPTYIFTGDFEKAKSYIDKGLAMNPKFPNLLVGGFIIAAQRGDTLQARDFSDRIRDFAPNSSLASVFGQANLALQGDFKGLDRLVEASMKTLSDKKDELQRLLGGDGLSAGILCLATGDFERAEKYFRRALDLGPDGDAQGGLALCLMITGRAGEAQEILDQGLKQTPLNGNLLEKRALAAFLSGDPEAALRLADQRLGQAPFRTSSYLAKGSILAEMGRFDEARDVLEKAYARNPLFAKSELAYVLVAGDIDINRGVELAKDSMTQRFDLVDAARWLPLAPPAEETLGRAAMKNENFADALAWFEKAAARNPHREVLQTLLADARARAGRLQ